MAYFSAYIFTIVMETDISDILSDIISDVILRTREKKGVGRPLGHKTVKDETVIVLDKRRSGAAEVVEKKLLPNPSNLLQTTPISSTLPNAVSIAAHKGQHCKLAWVFL